MRERARRIIDLYAALICLYPRDHRREYGAEMRDVFADAVEDAARQSEAALIALCLRELRDWPRAALMAHWTRLRGRVKEVVMGASSLDTPGLLPVGNGPVVDRTYAILARHSFLQRAFDLAFAVSALVVAAPLILLLAIAIRLDSPGPAIFRQQRVGKGGRPFTLYKLRSMVRGAEQGPAATALSDAAGKGADPRITRVGHVIRVLKVDELPQLLNVVKGDMTILGPGPRRPSP